MTTSITSMNDLIAIDPWDGWKRLSFACEVTGLTRSWFYPRISDGRIRSAVLKDDGRSRGIRLIHMPSLKRFIEENLEEDNGIAGKPEGETNQ